MTILQDDLFATPSEIALVEAEEELLVEEVAPEVFEPPIEEPSPNGVGPSTTDSGDVAQEALFDLDSLDWWKEHWVGMPEFVQEDLTPWQSIYVHFECRADRDAFAKLVGQKITDDSRRTRSIWFPEAEIGRMMNKRFVATSPAWAVPHYPVYVISKGRWESRLTAKHLEAMRVPYRIVVEPQERDQYADVIDPKKILVLPFSNLGQGSIPARNWVWEHSIEEGHARHWILDDNIDGFFRLFRNIKTPVADGTIFRAMEDFADRHENIAMTGPNYFMFASRKTVMPPFYLNTRVYSCILLRNDLPFRWRGRYNEDGQAQGTPSSRR